MSRIVVALGGNALGSNAKEQLATVKKTARRLVDLVTMGHEIIITHGNGPQVGMIYKAMAATNNEDEAFPFAECGAMSQGYIGYHLQQAMQAEFEKRNMRKKIATIVSQVEVNPKDEAFKNPTKPIGNFYTKKEAMRLQSTGNGVYKEDAGRGYRRVVPSPQPIKICELSTIEKMIKNQLRETGKNFIRIGKSLIINKQYIYYINISKQQLELSNGNSYQEQLVASREALRHLKEIIDNSIV